MSETNLVHVESKNPRQGSRFFTICDNCFWVASWLDTATVEFPPICPLCKQITSQIPLVQDEAFRFDYSVKRGVELEFYVV